MAVRVRSPGYEGRIEMAFVFERLLGVIGIELLLDSVLIWALFLALALGCVCFGFFGVSHLIDCTLCV